ncbi:MAG: hypothetical protein GWN96_06485, partial [candidate division Zixibacteria bacterium]|nr:hypothetical protein [candidate division Zixibacteria bacterium]
SALKTRHTTAVATSGDQDVASIYEALTAVTGVSAAYVFDNDTQEAIGVVPSKTIRCSVIGGSDADVAEAIANSKTAGVPTYGATAQSVYNTTTRQSKTINFDRAVDTATHIEITLTKYDNYPDDGDAQIKAAIVSHFEDISIDDDVIYNALYQPIYSIPGCMVTALKLDTVDPPTGTSD